MHGFNSIKIRFCFFFITADLNFMEENLSEPFRSCTEDLNYKHCQPDKHHIITIIRYSQVSKLLEISLITISEALYPKVLLKNMVKRKHIFPQSVFTFPPSWRMSLTELFGILKSWTSLQAVLCTSQSQQWAPAPAAASSSKQWISEPEHCNESRDNKEHTSNIGSEQSLGTLPHLTSTLTCNSLSLTQIFQSGFCEVSIKNRAEVGLKSYFKTFFPSFQERKPFIAITNCH